MNIEQIAVFGVIKLVATLLLTYFFLIIASASILGWWMTFNQIPQLIADAFLSVSQSPVVVVTMIVALLLFIGLFMDINAALIILAPVLAPLAATIGLEPVHAGMIIILSLTISLMTPPVGACLFVLASVTGERIESITRSLWPFIVVELLVLLATAYWEPISLAIPRMLGLAG